MRSIQELFLTGFGPSSSHTMAPARAAHQFGVNFPESVRFRITLFGSLAATGKGHQTDTAITRVLAPKPVEIIWQAGIILPQHPNGMLLEAFNTSNQLIGSTEEFSIGGGSLLSDPDSNHIYPISTLTEILESCEKAGNHLWEHVEEIEGSQIWPFLDHVWQMMQSCIRTGLQNKGKLPGNLGLTRKADSFYQRSRNLKSEFRREALLAAYAYAVSEENASAHQVVTAPTCGSCGVLPAVLYLFQKENRLDTRDILRALATAGLIGNIAKTNGSVSGAMVGCQGEVGVACAMAAGAVAQLYGGSPRQIEYAAEMGLEHHLGLTCDPVNGLVQIPCIERNAHAACRALSCARFALLSDGLHRISFDDVIAVMMETGCSLSHQYKETSLGGLAKRYLKNL